MLLPPRDARQMAIVQWGLPLMGGLCWLMWARLRPEVGVSPEMLFTIAALTGWLWSVYAGGISVYGRMHGLLAPWVISVLWLYPLGTALLPKLAPQGGTPLDITFAVCHCITLAAAGLWHRARAKWQPHSQLLSWDGVAVDVTRRIIRAADNEGSWLGQAALAAAISIPIYSAMRLLLSVPEQYAIAALVMNLLSSWLYVGTMGRVLGQAMRLGDLERGSNGDRFSHYAVKEMQSWRRENLLYKFLQGNPPSK